MDRRVRTGTFGPLRASTPRSIVTLAAVAALCLPAAAFAQEPQTSLPDIEDEVMCIVCGVPLEHAPEAPQANQERDLIRQLIAAGLTKEEIKDHLVAEYGTEVLATPDKSGFDLAAWVVPGAAIIVAGGAIVVGLRRWRRTGTERSETAPEPALGDEDSKRLDADLARYKL